MNLNYLMKIECSWCKKDMGTKEGGSAPNQVTHSICKECFDNQVKQTPNDRPKQSY